MGEPLKRDVRQLDNAPVTIDWANSHEGTDHKSIMKKIAFFLSATMLFIPAVARAQASSTSSSGAQQTLKEFRKAPMNTECGEVYPLTPLHGLAPRRTLDLETLGCVMAASSRRVKRSSSSGLSTPFRLRFFQTLGLLLHPAAALFSIARVCTAGGSHQLV